jgi:hypothetical protein
MSGPGRCGPCASRLTHTTDAPIRAAIIFFIAFLLDSPNECEPFRSPDRLALPKPDRLALPKPSVWSARLSAERLRLVVLRWSASLSGERQSSAERLALRTNTGQNL